MTSQSKRMMKSSMVFSGLTLISRFLGLARDLVIGAALGASSTIMADAYNTALSFPNLFRRIFAEGAFAAAFVPAYSATLEEKGPEAADKLARDALATLAFATLLLSLAAQLSMPWLMQFIAPGFMDTPDKFKLTVILTQITMPYLPAMTLVALLSGVLNARGRFILSGAAPTLLNVIMLVAVIPQKDPLSAAYAAAWSVLASGIAQALLLIWGVRRVGARIGFAWPSLSPDIRNLLWLAVPGAIAATATQINVFVSQILSSEVDGARTWLNFADRLYQLPLGLVGVAIGVALLPALSRAVQAGDKQAAQTTMDDALVLSMALTLPAAAAMIAMPDYLIDGLFRRGEFTVFDSQQTALALLHYGWGVPAFVLTRVLTPAFFARRDTWGPMKFAFASVALNLALGIALFRLVGVQGLAMATSAAAWLNVGLMVITLSRRGVWTLSSKATGRLLRLILAGGVMGVFCFAAQMFRPALETMIAAFALPGGLSLAGAAKEVGILLSCFAGAVLYAGLVPVTGAVRISEVRAALRRKPADPGDGKTLPPSFD
ncbi:MAG: murein biosynthesis integral membrane protein MurJ [Asticcacaulis sp.]